MAKKLLSPRSSTPLTTIWPSFDHRIESTRTRSQPLRMHVMACVERVLKNLKVATPPSRSQDSNLNGERSGERRSTRHL